MVTGGRSEALPARLPVRVTPGTPSVGMSVLAMSDVRPCREDLTAA